MTNKLKMAILAITMSINLASAQSPEAASSEDTSPIDYQDTWQSPYITDEMTVDAEQNKSWRMGDYKFPSKPKHSWEFGLHMGHFFIDGDIDKNMLGGYGLGLHLRKAINYTLSIRASMVYGIATGLEIQPSRHKNNTGLNGFGGGLVESTFEMYDPMRGGPGEWFPAYKTSYVSGDLSAIFNIGNLLFHRERNKWNFFIGVGVGLNTYKTRLDLLDSNGLPYDGVRELIGWTPEELDTKAGRGRIKSALEELYDGDYETVGYIKSGIFGIGDEMNVYFVLIPTVGLSRKVNKRINIAIEHSVYLSDNDYLDGIKFRTAIDQTINNDVAHYTNLRIGINIGNFKKVTEPLYWMNPIDQAFNDIANLKSQEDLDFADEDNDGVIDLIDQQINTPEDCPVDTRGVILDSDGDGIVDCEDREPYSRPGCPVDALGIAECEEDDAVNEDRVLALVDSRLEAFKNSLESANFLTPNQTSSPIITNPDGSKSFESTYSDGSTVKTTQNSDGSILSTRKYEDGSYEKLQKGLDGNIDAEVADSEGNITNIKRYADGAQTQRRENPDGSITKSNIDPEGRIESETKYLDGTTLLVIKDLDGTIVSDKLELDGTSTTTSKRTDGVVKSQSRQLDGTLVTLVNDPSDKITKTVTSPDGQRTITEKSKDGVLTMTTRDVNGTETTTVQDTDGTITTEHKYVDGSYARTTQKPNHEVLYEALDSEGILTNLKQRSDGSQRIVISNDDSIISDEELSSDNAINIERFAGVDDIDTPQVPREPEILRLNNIPDFPKQDVSLSETDENLVRNDKESTTVLKTTIVHSGCGNWFLPMIHYDLNKSNIKPQYYSHLHNVAEVMRKCPDICVVAQGHTDNRHSNTYNTILSYKRAKAAIEYLTERYEIDRSRLKLMYGGEDSPMVLSASTEAHHFMNRRVEFRTCESADKDMDAPEGYTDQLFEADNRQELIKGNKASGY